VLAIQLREGNKSILEIDLVGERGERKVKLLEIEESKTPITITTSRKEFMNYFSGVLSRVFWLPR